MRQDGVGTIVAHNHIHDVRHHAFRQGGNNHLIEFNLVERSLLECWDCGACKAAAAAGALCPECWFWLWLWLGLWLGL